MSSWLLPSLLVILVALAHASTQVSKVTEDFIAKPNGQITTAKAVLVRARGEEEGREER